MYIKKLEIKNIRSISHFEMTFPKPAGWHVLIGDNGSGKTSIIRAIALGLLGPDNAKALSLIEDFSKWLSYETSKGSIAIEILRDNKYDEPKHSKKVKKEINCSITIDRTTKEISGKISLKDALWNDHKGWFLAAYGPLRRLRGTSEIFPDIANSRPRLGVCLTAFRDDAALTQLSSWLKDLALDAPKKQKAKDSLEFIVNFINNAKLLPGDAILLNDIDSDGIKIKDANGVNVSLFETSDGYRSVLSMTIDIIRFLMDTYGADKVFPNKNESVINLPGVVLIDEADAHLHPTWQTRIGQWFTNFFPNIQFIVTTHSPLVCRACENGSIWRLAAPGSDDESEEITGIDRDRLVFGNVLDAYGTEMFGKSVTISEDANDKRNRLAELNIKSVMGEITKNEGKELAELKAIFRTEKLR